MMMNDNKHEDLTDLIKELKEKGDNRWVSLKALLDESDKKCVTTPLGELCVEMGSEIDDEVIVHLKHDGVLHEVATIGEMDGDIYIFPWDNENCCYDTVEAVPMNLATRILVEKILERNFMTDEDKEDILEFLYDYEDDLLITITEAVAEKGFDRVLKDFEKNYWETRKIRMKNASADGSTKILESDAETATVIANLFSF